MTNSPSPTGDDAEDSGRAIDAGPNRALQARIRAAGFATTAELSRALDAAGTPVGPTRLSQLLRGKLPGRRRDGGWHEHSVSLAELLGCDPEDLFDRRHQCHPDDPMLRTDLLARDEADRLAAQSEPPDEACARREFKAAVAAALASLTAREERVLRSRFGIGGDRERTMAEIAEEFSVRVERIRQIEAKALRRLKHPARSRPLRAAWEGWSPEEARSGPVSFMAPVGSGRDPLSAAERRRPSGGGPRIRDHESDGRWPLTPSQGFSARIRYLIVIAEGRLRRC